MDNAPIELLKGVAHSSVILLHGLGANGNDLVPLAHALQLTDVRFVLPHAPVRHVTVNGGYPMPAWYDIRQSDLRLQQDDAGFVQSRATVDALIQQEITRGIPSSRIVLAGFSQGGAVALYSGLTLGIALAGIVCLSTYLPVLKVPGNIPPLWLAHGSHDEVIPLAVHQASFAHFPAADMSTHLYTMGHEIIQQEISDLRNWLQPRLSIATGVHP